MNTSETYCEYMQSPMGIIEILATEAGLASVEFVDHQQQDNNPNTHTSETKRQLTEYFEGDRKAFDLKLAPTGTQFQQQVWQALLAIPYGKTASYSDIAEVLKNPKAVRAVGAANGKNPIAIIVPCHRVIGSNGTLTGYAGGLDRKAKLLQLENPQQAFF